VSRTTPTCRNCEWNWTYNNDDGDECHVCRTVGPGYLNDAGAFEWGGNRYQMMPIPLEELK
jgi:hypothetical protein